MNYIDYAIILVMVVSIYSGYKKGLILSLISLSGWYIAAYISRENAIVFNWLTLRITNYVPDVIPPIILSPATSLIIFLITAFTLRLGLKIIGLIMFIGRFNGNVLSHSLGAICGTAYGLIILVILDDFFIPIAEHFMTLKNSWLLHYTYTLFPALSEHIHDLQNFIVQSRIRTRP